MTAATDSFEPLSFDVGADLSASQFCGVGLDTSGRVVLPSAGGSIVGVNMIGGATVATVGRPTTVRRSGMLKVLCGGTITPNDPVKVTSAGKFVLASGADVLAGLAVGLCCIGGTDGAYGSVVLGLSGVASAAGIEAVTTGALSATVPVSQLTIVGTKAFTLGDGTYVGQRKRVEVVSATSTPVGTLTLNDAYGSEPTSYVMTAQDQELEFEWTSTGWKLIAKQRDGSRTFVLGTDVPDRLSRVIDLSVTGTCTGALPNGQRVGESITVTCSVAASTPAGTLTGTYKTIAGVAGTSMSVNATSDYSHLVWNGAAWQELISNSATIS